MLNLEQVKSILKSFEIEDKDRRDLFLQLFRQVTKDLKKLDEIQEEIAGLNEVYQIHIVDLNLIFWIALKQQDVKVGVGNHRSPDLKVFLQEETALQIGLSTLSMSEAYMKGLLNVKGELSYAIKARNLIKLCLKIIKNDY